MTGILRIILAGTVALVAAFILLKPSSQTISQGRAATDQVQQA